MNRLICLFFLPWCPWWAGLTIVGLTDINWMRSRVNAALHRKDEVRQPEKDPSGWLKLSVLNSHPSDSPLLPPSSR